MFSKGPWFRNTAKSFGRAEQSPLPPLQGSVIHRILTTALCSIPGQCHYSHWQMRKLKLTEVKWLGQSNEKHWMAATNPALTFQSGALPPLVLGAEQEWQVINWLWDAPTSHCQLLSLCWTPAVLVWPEKRAVRSGLVRRCPLILSNDCTKVTWAHSTAPT